jgi:hypothetical protein
MVRPKALAVPSGQSGRDVKEVVESQHPWNGAIEQLHFDR